MAIFTLTMLANVINYLVQILMGRLLNTSDYGTLNALFSIITICTVPCGIIPLIISKYIAESGIEDTGIIILVRKTAKIVLIFGVFLLLFGVVFSRYIANIFNISENYLIILTFISVCLTFVGSITIGVLQGRKQFLPLGIFNLIIPIMKISLGIILVWMGYRIIGIIGAIIIGGVISAVVGLYMMRGILFSHVKISGNKMSGDVLKYAIAVSVISLCLAFMSNIDILLIKHYFSAHLSGIYSSASVLGRIILYVPNAIVIVMFPMVAQAKIDMKKALNILDKSLLYICILIFVSVLGLNAFPGIIIRILYGSAYLSAIQYLRLITIMIVPLSFIIILTNFYIAISKVKLLIISMLSACFAIVLLSYYFHTSIAELILIMSIIYLIVMFINLIPFILFHIKLRDNTKLKDPSLL